MPTARNRDYSAPPEGIKSVSTLYGWNDNVSITGAENPQTGAWRALSVDDNGNLNVHIDGNISISGVTIDQSVMEGYSQTGNALTASGNAYLASISGDTNFLRTGVQNVRYPTSTSTSNLIPSGGHFTGAALVTGIALPQNLNRRAWFIQNNSLTSPLYVEFGSPPTSTGSYSMILNPSIANGYGGDSFYDAPATYLGPVSISGNGQFIAWEF